MLPSPLGSSGKYPWLALVLLIVRAVPHSQHKAVTG